MAKVDVMNSKNFKIEHINIDTPVGVGEKNEKNDVMLIQALFRLVAFSEFQSKEYFGLTQADLPETKGVFDEKMIKTIWAFQRKMSHRLLNLDGKIHPADYKGRTIKKLYGRVMAITWLNMYAQDGALMLYNGDVIAGIKSLAPGIMIKPYVP